MISQNRIEIEDINGITTSLLYLNNDETDSLLRLNSWTQIEKNNKFRVVYNNNENHYLCVFDNNNSIFINNKNEYNFITRPDLMLFINNKNQLCPFFIIEGNKIQKYITGNKQFLKKIYNDKYNEIYKINDARCLLIEKSDNTGTLFVDFEQMNSYLIFIKAPLMFFGEVRTNGYAE